MSGAVQGLIGSLKAAAGGDPNWASVTLLLPGDGTNGAQNNTFLDGSTNNFSITRNGNTTQGTFSPFTAAAPYDPATKGGSLYLDGTGDYLAAPQSSTAWNFTGNFCFEAWVYLTAFGSGVSGTYTLFFTTHAVNNYFGVISTGGNNWFDIWDGSTNIRQSTGSQFQLNTWNHVAYVRNGSTVTGYLNGVSVVSATLTSTFGSANATEQLYIGSSPNWYPAQYLVNGYVSNVRVVRGSAIYTANFTPATAPLTAVTNTQLLLLGTNAGILDNSMRNDLETVGNAQISTAQSKFGGSSISFDGTGDLLRYRNTASVATFGTGDFTIETWVRFNSVTGTQVITDFRDGVSTALPTLYVVGTQLRYYANGADQITGGTLAVNTWYHIALARSGTSTRLFLDGVQIGSTYTDSTNYAATANVYIADWYSFATFTYPLNGYIDDLRITKGVARYTANFTPPAAAFPTF